MITGRKWKLVFQAHGTACHAERAFRSDVNGSRFEGIEAILNAFARTERQFDFAIGRQWNCFEAICGRDDFELVPHGFAFLNDTGQGSNNTIHLRFPGICDEHDLQGGNSEAVTRYCLT